MSVVGGRPKGARVVDWRRASWFVCLVGIADAYLWAFDVDGRWQLRYDNPAGGMLAILPNGSQSAGDPR